MERRVGRIWDCGKQVSASVHDSESIDVSSKFDDIAKKTSTPNQRRFIRTENQGSASYAGQPNHC